MPKRKALLVALDQYPNPANNLPSCVNDAIAFQQAIQSTYGFNDIRRLDNSEATLGNVESGLDWLFNGAAADDRLVFFFSGHGYQVQRGQNLDEVLCLYDQFLFDDVLSAKTQSLPPGVFTLVSDSCHSGGMYKVMSVDGATIEVAQTKVLKVPPTLGRQDVRLHVSRASAPAPLPALRLATELQFGGGQEVRHRADQELRRSWPARHERPAALSLPRGRDGVSVHLEDRGQVGLHLRAAPAAQQPWQQRPPTPP